MSKGRERPHNLTVTAVELLPDGYIELEYSIEHYPECYDAEGALACLIDWNLDGSTLEENLEYSGTSVTEVGTYQIEGYWEDYGSSDGYDTDTGIQLVQEKEKTA